MKIGLISDTHSYIDSRILTHFEGCDEIWHAGDIGSLSVTDALAEVANVRAVYGNIDNHLIRATFPEHLHFNCAGLQVYMTHIGGYPPKYNALSRGQILKSNPQLFICGHSHILKVIPDQKLGLLHMNPGAAGVHGFHKVRTIIRFEIENQKPTRLEIVELSPRHGA